MEESMGLGKYRVRVVRPVFQAVVMEVDANDEEEAVKEVLDQVKDIPEKEWVGSFAPKSYCYDVQGVVEVDPDDEDYDENHIFQIEQYRNYLLLKANTFTGEGEVIWQPWLGSISDLMVADLAMDWADELEEIRDEGASCFFEDLEKQVQKQAEVRKAQKEPAKIIPFKPRKKDQG